MFVITAMQIQVATPANQQGYKWLNSAVLDASDMTFYVKACESANIALTMTPATDVTMTYMYQIVLGANSNQKTLIKKGIQQTVVAQMVNKNL